MKNRLLLILGLLTVLLRCWGGVVFHSHILLGWGFMSLGEILLSGGVCHSSRGLPLLYGFTAAVFGVAGGAVRIILTQVFGFGPEPATALPAALLLFFTLIIWEGGGSRFLSFHQGARLLVKELLILSGGLVSFFLLVSALWISPAWEVGDPLMGLSLAVFSLFRAVPLLVNQTSRFLVGQE